MKISTYAMYVSSSYWFLILVEKSWKVLKKYIPKIMPFLTAQTICPENVTKMKIAVKTLIFDSAWKLHSPYYITQESKVKHCIEGNLCKFFLGNKCQSRIPNKEKGTRHTQGHVGISFLCVIKSRVMYQKLTYFHR